MLEYLRKDNSPLTISYTASSYATNVYFEAYDLDTEEFIQSGAATTSGSSIYSITFTADSTSYDRNIKLEIITTSSANAYNEIQNISLIRPYASVSRIESLATIPPNTASSTLLKLERRARLSLNAFIGHSFYKLKKDLTVYGNNTDVLTLPENLYRIDKIYEDDLLVYERDNSDVQLEYPIEIADSKNRIKIVNTSSKSKDTAESPIFSVFYYQGVFKKDHAYRIDGIWGWDYIPADIEQATALLVEDYLCNDFNIRNKNIAELSNDSYDIKYGSDFATGTGNLAVDNLIAHYKEPRYLVI
jgi:hypothetical protein